MHAVLIGTERASTPGWIWRCRATEPDPVAAVLAGVEPVENLWHYLRSHHWSNREYEGYKGLEEEAVRSLNAVCQDAEKLKTICNADYISQRGINFPESVLRGAHRQFVVDLSVFCRRGALSPRSESPDGAGSYRTAPQGPLFRAQSRKSVGPYGVRIDNLLSISRSFVGGGSVAPLGVAGRACLDLEPHHLQVQDHHTGRIRVVIMNDRTHVPQVRARLLAEPADDRHPTVSPLVIDQHFPAQNHDRDRPRPTALQQADALLDGLHPHRTRMHARNVAAQSGTSSRNRSRSVGGDGWATRHLPSVSRALGPSRGRG